jgi:small subunit ribosomal protein S5
MVPPIIHRVLTSAGIKDCSATIEGSRNPMQVLKATIQLLHSGVSFVPLIEE